MRGYETARQIIERQRAAVKALPRSSSMVESVGADHLKAILAGARYARGLLAGRPRRARRCPLN